MECVESKARSLSDDSKIAPEISIRLAENVEGFQQRVKEILKLIQEDGNFSETTAINYDRMRSELNTQVTELSHLHTVLADQHNYLIGEFSRNFPSLIEKQHLVTSDSSSPQVTQMFTPDQMSNAHKFRTPIGFDVLLSSGGGGSYNSRREGSESSFSLSSDSDSESFMSINKLLISPVNDDAMKLKESKAPEILLKKISNLEEELVSLNTKLQSLTDENTKLKHEIHEKEAVTELNADMQSHLDSAQDVIKTQNVHLEAEKAKVIDLQNQVVDLKVLISDSNRKVETISEELEAYRVKLSAAEDEVSKLKNELSSKIFEQTHWLQGQLGSTQQEIALLQRYLDSEKDKVLALQEEASLCMIDISVRDEQIAELNSKLNQATSEISQLKSTHKDRENIWNSDILKLKTEIKEKCGLVDDLNKNMDALKHKHDNLMTERDGIKAQLDTLGAAMCSRDNIIQELERRLDSVQVEHVGVLASFSSAQQVTNELKLKVDELEREVDRQREVMSDRAEEKREAIRQLSFSLEHYMSGYKELRQAFIGNKRHAVLTS